MAKSKCWPAGCVGDKNMVPNKVAKIAALFVLSVQVLVPSRGQITEAWNDIDECLLEVLTYVQNTSFVKQMLSKNALDGFLTDFP